MKKDYRKEPFRYIVAIGDSITAGGSATKREYCWVSRLARLISEFQEDKISFYNAGIGANVISGRSTAYEYSGKPSAMERYKRDVISRSPDLVLISYGLNDMRCGTPMDVFLEDMDIIVKDITDKTNALIIIVNTYFMTGFKRYTEIWGKGSIEQIRHYNERMCTYAKEKDLLYADAYDAQGEAEWVIDYDECHPNNLGHALIANRVFEVLAKNCSCLSLKAFKEAGSLPGWRDESVLMEYNGL